MAPMRPLSNSQEWLEQSSLLLKAHPTTTRISSKYTIEPASTSTKSTKPVAEATAAPAPTTPAPPRATFKLKTYDPVSGVCLTYRTDKAAEVGRLVANLGSLGRSMCGLPAKVEDVTMVDTAAPARDEEGVAANTPEAQAGAAQNSQQHGGGGGGGGKKKKKGKK